MFRSHPFVGVGINTYREAFDQYYTANLTHEVKIPDSIYLWHLAETGIFGFFGLLVLLFNAFVNIRTVFSKLEDEEKNILFTIICAFCALLINMGTFDGFLWQTPLSLFWIFYASIAAIKEKAL
jgi:O-antigen ligase